MTHGGAGGKSEGEPDPPDGGWGWVVVFASFMVRVVIGGVTYSFGILYLAFLNHFNEGAAATSWIASILVAVTYGSGIVSSILVNKYGCRAVTIAGAIWSAVCLIVSMFAPNVLTLYFTIGIGAGFGFGLLFLPPVVSVTFWFKRKRSLATGIAVAGSGLGTFAFSPLTNWMLSEYGWRGTLLLIGALLFQCATFGALFRPVYYPKKESYELASSDGSIQRGKVDQIERPSEGQPGREHQDQSESYLQISDDRGAKDDVDEKSKPLMVTKNESRGASGAKGPLIDFALFRKPVFILFIISNFCTGLGYSIPFVYVVAQAKSRNIANAEFILSVIGIANTLGRLVLGYICDKTSNNNKLYIYNSCLIGCGLATALSALSNTFTLFALYGSVFGLLISSYIALTPVILVDLLGLDRFNKAYGILLVFQGISALIGPPIAGWLYDATSSYDPGFVVAGALIAVSGLMLFAIPPMQRRSHKKSPDYGTVNASK